MINLVNPQISAWAAGAPDAVITSYTVSAPTLPETVKYLVIFGYGDSTDATSNPNPTPTRCRWGAVNATLQSITPYNVGANGMLLYCYTIANPTPGTANIEFNINGTIAKLVAAVAVTATNAVTATFGTQSVGQTLTPSCSIASANLNKTLYALNANNKLATEVTSSAGQTTLVEVGDSGFAYAGLDSEDSTGTPQTGSWTITNTVNRTSALAVNFAEATFAVDSINGGNDLRAGQSGFAYTTTGAASIASITTNQSGVTVSGISDVLGDGTANLSDRVDGGPYPSLPVSAVFTFTDNLGNTATFNKTITYKSTELKTVTAGLVLDDNTFLGSWIAAAGFSTADGNDIYYVPVNNLMIFPNGGVTADSPGMTTFFYRDSTTGNNHLFNLTFNQSGVVGATLNNRTWIGIGVGI